MNEFALIEHYFTALCASSDGVVLGIGDDAALLAPTPDHHLVVTTDTLISGRHFARDADPESIGHKALAVNLSDLAAMGAQPRWWTLALSLPQPDAAWLTAFARGLKTLADIHQIALVGGDTTRGELSITITALGEIAQDQALHRSGARAGDAVCVTGTLGDAALALRMGYEAPDVLRQRLDRPTPRVAAGVALRRIAHAAIDISDGLAGDLVHVLNASGVGAEIHADRLPMSAAFIAHCEHDQRAALQLAGGDDYELCFCLPPECIELAQTLCAPLPLTVIGRVTEQPGLHVLGADGVTIPQVQQAYQHFL